MIGIEKKYAEHFPGTPLIVASPGRINIIGEHTDYNDGFVLPAAIDKAIYVAVQIREDNIIALYSAEYNEKFETAIDNLSKSNCHWANYILGVVDQCFKRGLLVSGFNMVIDGDLPIGAGLSSSAAVECAVVFALNELFKWQLPKMKMVKLTQQAEHEFSGVMCGIMDMFASMHGKPNHAMKLDCRSLIYEYVPLNLTGYKFLLFNTNVKHSLASSAYNERREQCNQGVELIKQCVPGVSALRDVTPTMLEQYVLPKDELIYRRCNYVVNENLRVEKACEDLKKGNLQPLGKSMFATHEGLSKDYEVSCNELDILIDIIKNDEAVLGARMMGGGFGGCTISLVKESAIDRLINTVSEKYYSQSGLQCEAYVVAVADGTCIIP